MTRHSQREGPTAHREQTLAFDNAVSATLGIDAYQRLQRYCEKIGLYRSEAVTNAIPEHLEKTKRDEQLQRLNELHVVLDQLAQSQRPTL